jgi:hypothetical protein
MEEERGKLKRVTPLVSPLETEVFLINVVYKKSVEGCM